MKQIWDFILRHSTWVLLGVVAVLCLQPAIAEIKTMLLIIAVESLALALSGLAVYAYTRIDFTKDNQNSNPGLIFLGVHLCVGLVVLGVYIAQFSN